MESISSKAPASQHSNQSQAFASKSKFISLPPPPQKLGHVEEEDIHHPVTPLNQNTSRPRDASNRRSSNPKPILSPVSLKQYFSFMTCTKEGSC